MVETPGKITLWQVEIFVAVAEEASITSAARRLEASPSAVSQQLSNLEAALGAALMTRNERPMQQTPAGQIFLRRAHAILHEASMATSELAVRDLSARMKLRLGLIEDFDAEITPALLTRLSQIMPKAHFLLETGATHRLITQLEARALDVVVAADPGDMPTAFEVHPLMEDPFIIVTPRGMVGAGDDIMSRLRQTPLLRYTSRHIMGRQIASHLAQSDMKPSHRFELDSYHAILSMVARGEGWSILTPLGVFCAKRFLDQVDLFPLPFSPPPLRSPRRSESAAKPLSRRLSLIAPRGELEDMPGRIAQELRQLLEQNLVCPAVGLMPWARQQLRIVSPSS